MQKPRVVNESMPMDGPSDAEIISRIGKGDINAFEVLVHRYASLVARIVSKHVPRDRVDEVSQDVFVAAYRSLGSFSQESPFGHWLSKVAVRCCYNFWRERRKESELFVSDLSEDAQSWIDNVLATESHEAYERQAAGAEAAEILAYGMARLSAEDRMVLSLVHLDGRSIKESADLLGWSTVTVKVRAHRARKKLRQFIEGLLENRRGEA